MSAADRGDRPRTPNAQSRIDRRIMRLALREAARGRPSPNPHVGAVLTTPDGGVIAVGHHARAGDAHAEVAAIRAASGRAAGATLYVTFEPCNHHGRTPPCTEAILAAGIARVVFGCADPAPHVAGATAKLRSAGVIVDGGVLEAEATELVADFTKHITRRVPFITLKAALTLDGRLATRTGESKWITGALARREAHRLRDASDAVLVGVGTVLADDPALTVRDLPGGRTPLRAVLDTHLRTPPSSELLRDARESPVVLYHGPGVDAATRASLDARGATLVETALDALDRVDVRAVFADLGARDVVRLLVEGGARVHGACVASGEVDRVALFFAPKLLADADATPLAFGPPRPVLADALTFERLRVRRFGADLLVAGTCRRSPSTRASGADRP